MDYKKILNFLKHYGIHILALILSLAAVFHTMIQFSKDLTFKFFFGTGALFVDLFAQYLRGVTAALKARNEKGDRLKAFGIWVIIVLYLIVFAFISAFGVLLSQVNLNERAYAQVNYETTSLNADIKRVTGEINSKIKEREEEWTRNGRGKKYESLEQDVKDLKVEKAGYETDLKLLSKTIKTSGEDTFSILKHYTGIPANWFIITMFSMFMAMIYIALMITPWKISLNKPVLEVNAYSSDIGTGTPGEVGQSTSESASPSAEVLPELQEVFPDEPGDSRKVLLQFTEALFTDNKKLNGDQIVSQKTGISPEECAKYRKYLSELHIGDKTAIFKTQGGSVANYPKGELLEYIRHNAPETI